MKEKPSQTFKLKTFLQRITKLIWLNVLQAQKTHNSSEPSHLLIVLCTHTNTCCVSVAEVKHMNVSTWPHTHMHCQFAKSITNSCISQLYLRTTYLCLQLGEENAEGWPHRSLQLPRRGQQAGRGVLISLWRPATGLEEMEWSCVRGSSD